MKKNLSLFLALALCIALLPVNAFAGPLPESSAVVSEEAENSALPGETPVFTTPTAITISIDEDRLTDCALVDGKIVGRKGFTFGMAAVDQNGAPTPVTWSTSTSACSIDADGVVSYNNDIYGGGSTSYIYVQATSVMDTSIKSPKLTVYGCGYKFSASYAAKTTALSTDGQTAKTVAVSGGYSGHTVWTTDADAAVAEWKTAPTNNTSVTLNLYRPGVFHVTEKMDFDETMTDTATITVTGVAVEGEDGTRTKIYVDEGAEVRLKAYTAEGRTVSSWSSSDESVAAVDENGLVTGVAAGSVIISAKDSEGAVGGIKVVVRSAVTPYFEAIEFLTTAVSGWTAGSTYKPATSEYTLDVKSYSTTKLTMQATTLYDTEKYAAEAEYTDSTGADVVVPVRSGSITYLENIPFGSTDITITIVDKNDAENKTAYVFHVTRPRDNTKVIRNTSGLVIAPEGRSLSAVQYNGKAEGTFFQADASGAATNTTTITGTKYNYRTFIIGNDSGFKLTFTGNTAYQHLRYSDDDGSSWTELPQGGGNTAAITFPEATEGHPVAKVLLQVLDDKTYYSNVTAGKDGFADSAPNTYTVWVERISVDAGSIGIMTAALDNANAECYPAELREDVTSYTYIVPNGTSAANLTYTVSGGAAVKVGSNVQAPDENGVYTLQLKTGAQTVSVSKDGVTKAYSFKLQARSAMDYADKVVDYLCVNSQYTNITYGIEPQTTLSGTLKSLGNWGGYITYYFKEALTDDPANKYGMDFYVYGNANKDTSTATKMSFFEPGQVWVSEDGSKWYALAGSAHYEDGVDWNYTVEYSKAENGKTAWTDNHGNSNDGSGKSGNWVSSSVYFLNDLAKKDKFTLTGIMLPSADGSVCGDGGTDAYPIKWGYSDALPNGTIGADVNPYADNSDWNLNAGGFDLEWAVNEDGMPIDVEGMEFHYVKVVTASNIWHNAFCEKSTECSGVLRTTAQPAAVGRTAVPTGITVTDGKTSKSVEFTGDKQVYTVELGDMETVTLTVDGAADEDNIYINNYRGASLSGLSAAEGKNGKLVRVIVQNGDKEPVICMIRLIGGSENEEGEEGGEEGGSSAPIAVGEVKVIIENSAYSVSDGAAWDGVLVDKWVELYEDSTMMSCVIDALGSYSQTGAESGYITEINGLEAFDGGAMSGWMGTLNDWFTAEGFDAYTVKKDTLSDGDIISILYSCEWGADIGSDWSSSDTSLSALSVSGGILGEAFDPETLEYTVRISGSSAKLLIEPAAANKNYMVKTFLNEKVTSNIEGSSFCKRAQTVSVKDGDKIYVGVGEAAWPSMNGPAEATWYVLKIVSDEDGVPVQAGADKAVFTDVPADAYYADAVDWAVGNNVTAGIAENKFGTGDDCTREQMVTFLWNLAGKPEAEGENFSDVRGGAYYEIAIAWAKNLGIAAGKNNGSFGVGETVTREQVITFLWNYAGKPEPAETVSFSDVPADAYYAKAAAWAKEKGITVGTGSGLFGTGESCTREQIVTFMYKYFAK